MQRDKTGINSRTGPRTGTRVPVKSPRKSVHSSLFLDYVRKLITINPKNGQIKVSTRIFRIYVPGQSYTSSPDKTNAGKSSKKKASKKKFGKVIFLVPWLMSCLLLLHLYQ